MQVRCAVDQTDAVHVAVLHEGGGAWYAERTFSVAPCVPSCRLRGETWDGGWGLVLFLGGVSRFTAGLGDGVVWLWWEGGGVRGMAGWRCTWNGPFGHEGSLEGIGDDCDDLFGGIRIRWVSYAAAYKFFSLPFADLICPACRL